MGVYRSGTGMSDGVRQGRADSEVTAAYPVVNREGLVLRFHQHGRVKDGPDCSLASNWSPLSRN